MIASGGFVRPAFQFANAFFHFFARLEGDHEFLGNKDLLASPGITSLASSPLFDLENAEIPQFDAFVLDQGLDNRVEGLLDDFLGLELRETNLFGNGLYDFFFRHDEVPFRKDRRAASTSVEKAPLKVVIGRCGKAPFSLQV